MNIDRYASNLFFYDNPAGWVEKTVAINKGISREPSSLQTVLEGKEVVLYMPKYMYSNGDDYLTWKVDDKDSAPAKEIASKINEALASGKVILFRTHHNLSGGCGGQDWFSAEIGAIADTMENVKKNYKQIDMDKDAYLKFGKIWFVLTEKDSDGVR